MFRAILLIIVFSLKTIFFGIVIGTINEACGAAINRIAILQYHHIDNTSPRVTSVSPDQFAAHLQWIFDNGFTVLSLPNVIDDIKAKRKIPDKSLVITFDDGYKSIYEFAFPLLKKYNYPFTLFVSTNPIVSAWGDSVSWSQLREMQKHGATIANHGVYHDHLLEKRKSENHDQWLRRVSHDIVQAENIIKQKTGVSYKLFAYPYGEFNNSLKQQLKQLGYIAFGQHSGPLGENSDFQAVPRFPVSGIYSQLDTWKTKLLSLPFTVTSVMPNHHQYDLHHKVLSLEIGLKPGDFSWQEFRCFYQGKAISLLKNRIDHTYLMANLHVDILEPSKRIRFNCTAPNSDRTRYYWYSYPWFKRPF